jgi:hypothetical protein
MGQVSIVRISGVEKIDATVVEREDLCEGLRK